MDCSLDLTLVYGVLVTPEQHPWYDAGEEDPEVGIDAWWKETNGYKCSFDPFSEDGDLRDEIVRNDPRLAAYFNELREWEMAHPPTFDIAYNKNYKEKNVFICAPTSTTYYTGTSLEKIIEDSKTTLSHEEKIAFEAFLRRWYPMVGEPNWVLLPFYD